MKVVIVTNSDERCGIAEYGRNLCGELEKYFTVTSQPTCPTDASEYGVVFINWSPYTVFFTKEELQRMKQQGARVLVLMHESVAAHRVNSTDALCEADVVVTHEPMSINGINVKVRMIPHGIVEVDDLPEHVVGSEPRVGTAGFCFPDKHMEVTVQVANSLGGIPLLIAPSHGWHNPTPQWQKFREMSPKLELITDFLSEEETIRRLATCDINVYMAKEEGQGQSGSARMIIGARRPTILIRSRKTHMLEHWYSHELYFVSSFGEAQGVAREIWTALQNGTPVKRPDTVITNTGWTRIGETFRDLFLEMCPTCV